MLKRLVGRICTFRESLLGDISEDGIGSVFSVSLRSGDGDDFLVSLAQLRELHLVSKPAKVSIGFSQESRSEILNPVRE